MGWRVIDSLQYCTLTVLRRMPFCLFAGGGAQSSEYPAYSPLNPPQDLLRDHIHLNDAGCALMAKLVGEELLGLPRLGDGRGRRGLERPDVWVLLRAGGD